MRGRPLPASARSLACALCLLVAGAHPAVAQTGANVLVVANAAAPGSADLANYYAQKRQVPAEQVLTLPMPVSEEISRAAFTLQIEKPLADWLTAHSAQDRILYIVLMKGVPIIVCTGLYDATMAAKFPPAARSVPILEKPVSPERLHEVLQAALG